MGEKKRRKERGEKKRRKKRVIINMGELKLK